MLVQSGGTTLLVEAGLGPRQFKQRLELAGLAGCRPDALLVTHAHYDHVKNATEVAGGFGIPTLATRQTAEARATAGLPLHAHLELVPGAATRVGCLTVCAFSTPHDAPGSVGVVVHDGQHQVGVVTDLGCVTAAVVEALQDCHLLYAEFNHDVQRLMDGPYPWSLKQRCRSNVGHLSNEQGAELVARSRTGLMQSLVLAHLSESNNMPELALFAARKVLDGSGVDIRIASQRHVLGPLKVHGTQRRAPAAPSYVPVALPAQPPRVPSVVTVGHGRRRSGPVGSGPSAQLSLFA